MSLRLTALSSSLLVIAVVAGACAAAGDNSECRIGADCPSGACQGGQCVEMATTTGPTTTGGGEGGQGGAGGATSTTGGGSTVSTSAGGGDFCANHDFVVERDELTLMPGLSATLRAAQDVTFHTAGDMQPDGSRIWDFTAALAGDHDLAIATQAIDGAWYADSFAGATYAARLADSAELLGVFEVTSDALLLRGVVSPEDGLYATELEYDPPVTVLDFPISEGKTWSESATVSGLAQGVGVFYYEDYTFTVDARGAALTPYGELEVLRIHSELVRTINGFPTTVQSHSFVAECFGAVANVTSEDHELDTEFSDAAEVRRLAP